MFRSKRRLFFLLKAKGGRFFVPKARSGKRKPRKTMKKTLKRALVGGLRGRFVGILFLAGINKKRNNKKAPQEYTRLRTFWVKEPLLSASEKSEIKERRLFSRGFTDLRQRRRRRRRRRQRQRTPTSSNTMNFFACIGCPRKALPGRNYPALLMKPQA